MPEKKTRKLPLAWSVGAWALILAALLASHFNGLESPFIFDDHANIVNNSSIRDIRDIPQIFAGSQMTGLRDRPLVNGTLAVNYALGQYEVFGYHLFNLAIHFFAALALFALVRSCLNFSFPDGRYGRHAFWPGLFAALWWALHPVQTIFVAYTVQRCESLMGLLYILTVYCSFQGFTAQGPRARIQWHLAAVAFFLLGTGAKDVIVTAPLMVFAFDWVFFGGRVIPILRRSTSLYLGLGLVTTLILFRFIAKMAGAGDLGANPSMAEHTWGQYLASQPGILLHYLRQCLWPETLIFHYDWPAPTAARAALSLAAVVSLAGLSVWAVLKRKPAGLLGVWFFLILLPTALFPLNLIASEHRLYLSLAALTVPASAGLWRLAHLLPKKTGLLAFIVLAAGVSLLLGNLTIQRNKDYETSEKIWSDTVEKAPLNHVARHNLGRALVEKEDYKRAVRQFERVLQSKPDWAATHYNLGNAFSYLQEDDQALNHYRQASRLMPDMAGAWAEQANVLSRKGLFQQALPLYEKALGLDSELAPIHFEYANTLGRLGLVEKAGIHYRRTLDLDPSHPQAPFELANALAAQGQTEKALEWYRKSWREQPENVRVGLYLGIVLVKSNRAEEARDVLADVLKLAPDNYKVHIQYAKALTALRDMAPAEKHFLRAIQLAPDDMEPVSCLAQNLLTENRLPEAVRVINQGLVRDPDYPGLLNAQAILKIKTGELPEAYRLFQQALDLDPENLMARQYLQALEKSGRLPKP